MLRYLMHTCCVLFQNTVPLLAGDVPAARPEDAGRRDVVFSDSDGGEESGSEGDVESGTEDEGEELRDRSKRRRWSLSESASDKSRGRCKNTSVGGDGRWGVQEEGTYIRVPPLLQLKHFRIDCPFGLHRTVNVQQ